MRPDVSASPTLKPSTINWMAQSGGDRDLRKPTFRNKEGHRPSPITDGVRLRYSIIKKREKGLERLGGRSAQRECSGEKQNGVRGARLQRSHDDGPLSRRTFDDWQFSDRNPRLRQWTIDWNGQQ